MAAALLGFLALSACGDDGGDAAPAAADAGDTHSSRPTNDAAPTSTSSEDSGGPAELSDGGLDGADAATETAAADAALPQSEPDAEVAEPATDSGAEDVDRDGFSVNAGDCDDFNNTVYPGATEASDDGLDSDCDGEELPAALLVWGLESDDNLVDALELFDVDGDGEVSQSEFALACATSAKLTEPARPGIVQLHASCAGSNSCRGMVYQSWNELYEHSCRGVNQCAGWSCVETAEDQGRTGPEAFDAATCGFCHTGPDEGTFLVKVPPSEDVEDYVTIFFSSRSDEYLRTVIAFGVDGIAPDGQAYSNMPGAFSKLSRAEMDTLIDYLRSLNPVGEHFTYVAGEHGMAAPANAGAAPVDAGPTTVADAGQPADAAP